jgi:competence protein ComEC
MNRPSETAIAVGNWAKTHRFGVTIGSLRDVLARAVETEIAQRRPFLWLPVAAGSGAITYLTADRDTSLVLVLAAAVVCGWLAWHSREHRIVFFAVCGICAFFVGEFSAAWRTARVAAPMIERTTIANVEGFIEQIDFRRSGARFILKIEKSENLAPEKTPVRVRLTTLRAPPFEAGTYVRLKARLLPPARPSLPGGYDFARDAYFARLGAVGSALGRIDVVPPPVGPSLDVRARAALDRGRNALARRIDAILGGDAGAIAVAMVTGKRDLLSPEAKEVIREAGIFHIITIAGVQMTLVAAICFVGLRKLLALSPTLALRYPIKKWAAFGAILLAIFYDIATGSRVGTERALFMTLIMLTAVLLDRQALSMRNLAFATFAVILIEPEALLGASFQLSFAAVAALLAVYEARVAAVARDREEMDRPKLRPAASAAPRRPVREAFDRFTRHGLGATLFATFCATAATASFMAYNFHELSPYVLIGNPVTLSMIEIFAVPGALLGTLLYPLGLDPLVWRYVGVGIDAIMATARLAGHLPGATLHLPAFAPWAIVFLSLAVLSVVLWRTLLFRATAIPFALLGLVGATSGQPFDIAIAPTGEAVAFRGPDRVLAIIGSRPSLFAAEQWLRADADGRAARGAVQTTACDEIGCIGRLPQNRVLALVLDKSAFAEDCGRADIVVTPLFAPIGCAAKIVIDRDTLRETGAQTLTLTETEIEQRSARAPGEDRPWSRAPPPRWGRSAPLPTDTRFRSDGNHAEDEESVAVPSRADPRDADIDDNLSP